MQDKQIPDDIVLSPNEVVADVVNLRGETLLATNRRIVHRRSTLLNSDEKVYPIRTTYGIQTRKRTRPYVLIGGLVAGALGFSLAASGISSELNLTVLFLGILLILGGVATLYLFATTTMIVIKHGRGETTITVGRSKSREAQRFAQTVSAIVAEESW